MERSNRKGHAPDASRPRRRRGRAAAASPPRGRTTAPRQRAGARLEGLGAGPGLGGRGASGRSRERVAPDAWRAITSRPAWRPSPWGLWTSSTRTTSSSATELRPTSRAPARSRASWSSWPSRRVRDDRRRALVDRVGSAKSPRHDSSNQARIQSRRGRGVQARAQARAQARSRRRPLKSVELTRAIEREAATLLGQRLIYTGAHKHHVPRECGPRGFAQRGERPQAEPARESQVL